jgi:hypothetical protein
MKMLRGHVVVVGICLLAFLFVAERRVVRYVSAPERFEYRLDTRLSREADRSMRLFIEQADSCLFRSMDRFCGMIKQRFPYVRSMQTKMVPVATMRVSCRLYDPCYNVNNTHLIVADASQALLCSAGFYAQEACVGLPRVNIEESVLNTYNVRDLHGMLSQLPRNLFDLYHVDVKERYTMVLRDKKQPSLTLITRRDSDMRLVEKCGAYVRELLEGRKAFDGGAVCYTADLRFNKHIILSKNLKEE